MISTLDVFLFALVTALATGLGALPFLFVPRMSKRWLGISNAVAAGLMLAASGSLVYEGIEYSLWRVAAGAAAGWLFIALSERLLERQGDLDVGKLRGADAKKALLIVGIMTVHSITEGIGVGVSFGGGLTLGIFITLAIAVHNIPEGLAISLVLVPRGESVLRAAMWSIVSSLPQPLLAVPAFLFVETFEPFLPVGLGFAAGAMVWMVLMELLPDARRDTSWTVIGIALLLSAAAMVAFLMLVG